MSNEEIIQPERTEPYTREVDPETGYPPGQDPYEEQVKNNTQPADRPPESTHTQGGGNRTAVLGESVTMTNHPTTETATTTSEGGE